MKPSEFLKQLKEHNTEQHKIVATIRNIIVKDKETTEEIKYGGLLYSRKKPYTGLFVSKNHVSMEFSSGAKFNDPKGLLEGSGKYRRHLKFQSLSDVDVKVIENFLKQALKH